MGSLLELVHAPECVGQLRAESGGALAAAASARPASSLAAASPSQKASETITPGRWCQRLRIADNTVENLVI